MHEIFNFDNENAGLMKVIFLLFLIMSFERTRQWLIHTILYVEQNLPLIKNPMRCSSYMQKVLLVCQNKKINWLKFERKCNVPISFYHQVFKCFHYISYNESALWNSWYSFDVLYVTSYFSSFFVKMKHIWWMFSKHKTNEMNVEFFYYSIKHVDLPKFKNTKHRQCFQAFIFFALKK